MKLLSASELKSFLEITDITRDRLIVDILDQISKDFETYCNRNFTKTTYIDYFNGGKKMFYLKAYPVDTTQTLTVQIYGTTYTADSEYFVWTDDGLVEFIHDVSTSEPRCVKISYTGGYAEVSTNTTPTTWIQNTAYSKGNRVFGTPSGDIQRIYRCTTTGTSGGSAPVWTSTVSGTVTDGTITWTEDSGNKDVLAVPDDLKSACKMQSAFEFQNRLNVGISSFSTPDGNINVSPLNLLPKVKIILDFHKRIAGMM